MIFTELAPNLLWKDVQTACRYFFLPWYWPSMRHGNAGEEAQHMLSKHFDGAYVQLIDSGRSAILVSLQALRIQEGDEVLLQAYTCMVVPNAILAAGAIPVYVDVTGDGLMDPADAEKKITARTRAIIIQHTFGMVAPLHELLPLARKHNLKTIEDCAHTLSSTYGGKKLGTIGDVGICSFGNNKAISTGRGGAIVTKDAELASQVEKKIKALPRMPRGKVLQHLLHFPIFWFGKKTYHLGIGKIILALSRKLGITHVIMSKEEKRGEMPSWVPARYPNALAHILIGQFKTVDAYTAHRRKISGLYDARLEQKKIEIPPRGDGAVLPRYPVLVDNPERIHAAAKKEGIFFGDWYDTVIAPKGSSLNAAGYVQGNCPTAEALVKRSLNLPNSWQIGEKEAGKIIQLMNRIA